MHDISIWLVVGLMAYALVMTGLWLATMIGAGKDRQDYVLWRAQARAEVDYWGRLSDKHKRAAGLTQEVLVRDNKDLEASHKLLKLREEEIKKLEADKRLLAERYVKTSNEYAWYRTLVRAHDSEAHWAAQAEMICRRKSVVGCAMDEPLNTEAQRNGGTEGIGQNHRESGESGETKAAESA